MDLTITPPPGYREVTHARWTWADPDCGDCNGAGILWTPVWDRAINPYSPLYNEDSDCDCVWTPAADIREALYEQYLTWGNLERSRDAWEGIALGLGPRRPGGWYWNGYWHAGYTVISIAYSFHDGDPASPGWEITVQWDRGHTTTHRTPWDARRDSSRRRPVQHPGPAPAPPELRQAPPAAPAPRTLWSLVASRLRSQR